MRIVLVTREYPPETAWGGIGTAVRHLALGFRKAGHEVRVVSWTAGDSRTEAHDGFPVDRLATGSRPRSAAFFRGAPLTRACLKFSFEVNEHLKRLYREWPFEMVEAPETLAALHHWARQPLCPWVTRLYTPMLLRSQWNREALPGAGPLDLFLRNRMERGQFLASTGMCSPSRFLAGEINKVWRFAQERIAILPNPFQLSEVEENTAISASFEPGSYVLFFGRNERRKGVHELAQAADHFLTAVPDAKLVCVGKDLDRVLSGAHEHVMAFAHQPPERLYPLIRGARFVVLPSLKENFPMACLEAMSLGKLVVGTRHTGFEEIIEDGVSGKLIPPGDVEALSTALRETWENPVLQELGEQAKARAKVFTPEVLIPRIITFYENIRRPMRI